MSKTVAIVQARMNSSRLPKKVMMPICNIPMIEILLHRLSKSSEIDEIILATTNNQEDIPLINHINKLGFKYLAGDESDVLERFWAAAAACKATNIVRITGDCPIVDPELLDKMLQHYYLQPTDYLSNISQPTFPDGLDVEIFNLATLNKARELATKPFDREHVTSYIRDSGNFKIDLFKNDFDYSYLRWTVDYPEDFSVIKEIFLYFSPNIYFNWQAVLKLHKNKPEIFTLNQGFERNIGSIMGTGQKLWQRAKKVIPGGNMLLSKRPEMYLPDSWPAYFKKTQGCRVWDLDANEYIDMSLMGVGTNILGYSNQNVDAAVLQTVQDGNLSTFNCPEEVYLAEKLIELHRWADMVKLARTGGEANAVSVRIARAASGRDNIAICGYHGWHDWYLSANLQKNGNLDGHLLPGLDPNGVPRALEGLVHTFEYNKFEDLKAIVDTHNIGVIKMEVSRNLGPEDNFLEKVRTLATKKNIVLIFDECTSGFRETFGGLHKKFGVEPDIAIFGKALGNGYGITSVIGRRDIMEAAQSTFISSTFWTERIGPSAALETINIMKATSSWEIITETGKNIREGWQSLADAYALKIKHFGLPALASFTFDSPKHLAYKTLITQEMLKKGYLAGTSVYTSTCHEQNIIDNYFEELEPIFRMINECEDGRDVFSILNGPVCHNGFKRLN